MFNKIFDLFKQGSREEALKAIVEASKTEKLDWKLRHLYLVLIAELRQSEFNTYSKKVPVSDHPNRAGLYFDLANVFLKHQKYQTALELFKKSLEVNQNYLDAQIGCAKALMHLQRYKEAEAINQRAEASLKTRQFEVLQIASKLRYWQDDFNKALQYSELSIPLYDNAPSALMNHAVILSDLRRFDEAITYYQRALELRPDYEKAHQYFGQVLLHQGDLKAGLHHYRWRWKNDDFPSERIKTSKPETLPDEPLPNRLLVWGEQGLGEQIMFGYVLSEASFHVATLIVQIDPRLIPLYQPQFPKISFKSKLSKIPETEYDSYITFGDLVARFRRDVRDLALNKHPLFLSDVKRVKTIRDAIDPKTKICGISWRSVKTQYGKLKSLTLEKLLPLLTHPGYKFVSLQYGNVNHEIESLKTKHGVEISTLAAIDNTKDIEGLASLISACDLVLSTSNVTVHLAGALNRPTLLLQPIGKTLWFWDHRSGETSLWYPSVKVISEFDYPDNWMETAYLRMSEN